MGECMSLCNTRGLESEDIKDNRNFKLPINDLEILKPPSLVEKKSTTEEKKELNKQRTPRLVKFTMDEKENPSKLKQKDPCLNFEEITDDIKNEKSDGEKMNEEHDISGLKYEEEEKDKKIEEINTDIPAKPEQSWSLLTDKLISNKISKLKDLEDSDEGEEKKEDKKEDNNNNNENNVENNEKDKEIKNNVEIEKIEENKKNGDNLEIKDEKKEEQKNDEKKEENEEEEEENEEEEEKENTGKEKNEKEEKKDINENNEMDVKEKTEGKFIENKEIEEKKVKEIKIEKEEENISNENKENQIEKEENIINENRDNIIENGIKAEKIEEINVKKELDIKNEIDIKQNEKSESDNNNKLLRGPQNKKEEEKGKEDNEENIDEEEEEEEDDEEEEKKNPESSKNQNEKSNSKDLSKYDLLIKIINKNLEAKGFSKSDVKNEIDNIYNSLPKPASSEDLSSKLIANLVKLLEITIESDKIEISNFIKDLLTIYENDKDKIYEKLMNFIEGIEEQEKLKTRKLNRQIRGYIKECQDKLKNRLKEEDIPYDKIITFEKFFKIVEETGVNLKEGYMDVLLYQMKIAVPKGKPINSVNAIVIVDFLK